MCTILITIGTKREDSMRIRFGFVANALGLWDASPSKTMTFKRYSSLPTSERIEKLRYITAQNIKHTKRILHYNIAHEIKLYRFSSSLVPLATHPEVMWDFITPLKKEWQEVGELTQQFAIRPSFHPNQFTLFTSPREEVTKNAIIDITYHYKLLEAMDILDDAIINIHIGGAYGDKKSAMEQFHDNFNMLPIHMKEKITLENDDKTYNVEETLITCEAEKIPMVLDYHHHMANQTESDLAHFLPRIFQTWHHSPNRPKIHLSSPKSDHAYRSHADFVSLDFVRPFLNLAKELNQDFDIMIEAKQKNLAMHKLIKEVASIRGVKRIDTSTLKW